MCEAVCDCMYVCQSVCLSVCGCVGMFERQCFSDKNIHANPRWFYLCTWPFKNGQLLTVDFSASTKHVVLYTIRNRIFSWYWKCIFCIIILNSSRSWTPISCIQEPMSRSKVKFDTFSWTTKKSSLIKPMSREIIKRMVPKCTFLKSAENLRRTVYNATCFENVEEI